MEANRHFTLIIAGDNPAKQAKPYSNKPLKKKRKVYEFSKAREYYDTKLKFFKDVLETDTDDDFKKLIKSNIEYMESLDPVDYYLDLTEGLDLDEETGDAYSYDNPNAKYDIWRIGKELSLPLITKKGKEKFSAKKGDVDWSKIHMKDAEVYEFVWDSVMEGKKPETEEEETLYNNMKNRRAYFEHFGNKENYVVSNVAFWGYAFLSEETGWVELEDNMDQVEWVKNFYKRFIEPLDDDTLITVCECIRY